MIWKKTCLRKLLEPFHIFSCYNFRLKYTLLSFFVIDQYKVVRFCEMKEKIHMVFKSVE